MRSDLEARLAGIDGAVVSDSMFGHGDAYWVNGKEMDDRLKNGPEMVSAKFVIPYPPGFPILVPGQVVTIETITYMRKLDVKEIHGYNANLGLELLKPDALAALKGKSSPGSAERPAPKKNVPVGA